MSDDGDGLGFELPDDGLSNLNPWDFLDKMRELPASQRAPYLQRWLDMVRKRDPFERDSLLDAGRSVFGYRMETIRGHMRSMKEVDEGVARTAITIAIDGEFLAETVYNRGSEQELGYLVYRYASDDPPEFHETLTVGKSVYYPPGGPLLEHGTILLPSGVEEFDTDWTLFNSLREFVGTYLHLTSPRFKTIAACYILMSWVYDRFDVLPYLRAVGDLGTGKSRLLQTIGPLCYRAISAGGAVTPAPMFRIIDRFRGTLVLDEMDFSGRSEHWDEIIKILNFGYQRGFPVLRAERGGAPGDKFDVVAYDCFSPKILASRRGFKDAALESRCFSHTMPLIDPDSIPTEMRLALGPDVRLMQQSLRNRLLLWRFRHYNLVTVDPTFRLPGVELRTNQILQPLLACSPDPRVQQTIMDAMVEYSGQVSRERAESYEGRVAKALLREWARRSFPLEIQLSSVADQVRSDDEMKDFSPRRVGDVLKRQLDVATKVRGGYSYVQTSREVMKRVANAYRISLEEYGGFDVRTTADPRVPSSSNGQPGTTMAPDPSRG